METKSSSSSNKRRKLISCVSSYVSTQQQERTNDDGDLSSATAIAIVSFESLNDDTLTTILEFVGRRSYKSFGGVNKRCKEIYLKTKGMTKETFLYGYAPLSAIIDRIERASEDNKDWAFGEGVICYNRIDILKWALERKINYLLNVICKIAAREERFDVLDEIWNKVDDEDDKRSVFQYVGSTATLYGNLDVLKWLERKGLDIDEELCAECSALRGELHILKWLREISKKGLELNGDLYNDGNNQLHVMKWLREQEVDWNKWTFVYAAEEGNLEVLQWLHDEGCPWPDYYRVREHELKPESLEWLLANGYGNRVRT